MKAPDIIYLHPTVDAKSGIEVGMEWHRSKIADSDTTYYSERAVRTALATCLLFTDLCDAHEIAPLVEKLIDTIKEKGGNQ